MMKQIKAVLRGGTLVGAIIATVILAYMVLFVPSRVMPVQFASIQVNGFTKEMSKIVDDFYSTHPTMIEQGFDGFDFVTRNTYKHKPPDETRIKWIVLLLPVSAIAICVLIPMAFLMICWILPYEDGMPKVVLATDAHTTPLTPGPSPQRGEG